MITLKRLFTLKNFYYFFAALILAVAGSYASAAVPAQQVYQYAQNLNYTALKYLGSSIDAEDSSGNTALCIALAKGDRQAYRTLLQYGANPRARCITRRNLALKRMAAAGGEQTFLGMGTTGWVVTGALLAGGIGIAVASSGGGGSSGDDPKCVGYQEVCATGYHQTDDTCTIGEKILHKCEADACEGYVVSCPKGYHPSGEMCRSGDTIMHKCEINTCANYVETCPSGYEETGDTCTSGDKLLKKCQAKACIGFDFDAIPEHCTDYSSCLSGQQYLYKCNSCEKGWTSEDCAKPAKCDFSTTECIEYNGWIPTGKVCQSGDTEYVECEPKNCTGYNIPEGEPVEHCAYLERCKSGNNEPMYKCTVCEDGYNLDSKGNCKPNSILCQDLGYTLTDCPESKYISEYCPFDPKQNDGNKHYHFCENRKNTRNCEAFALEADRCTECRAGWTGEDCLSVVDCGEDYAPERCNEEEGWVEDNTCNSGDSVLYKCKPAECGEGYKPACSADEYPTGNICPTGGEQLQECKQRQHAQNCGEVDPNSDKCLTCISDEYVLNDSGYCIEQDTACEEMQYTSEACLDGYYINTELGTCGANNEYHKCSRRQNTTKCTEYVEDRDECTACETGYGIKDGRCVSNATLCGAEFKASPCLTTEYINTKCEIDPTYHTCKTRENQTGCMSYELDADRCKSCYIQGDYTLDAEAGICVLRTKSCEEDPEYSPQNVCRANEYAELCVDNPAYRKCHGRQNIVDNCAEYQNKTVDDGVCIDCDDNYILSGNTCIPAPDCDQTAKPQHCITEPLCNNGDWTCSGCATGWKSDGGICNTCADGYHPDGDECVEDAEPDCDQTAKPQHCIAEPLCAEGDWTCSGCATGWKSDGGICNTCADGYHPDGDECVEDTDPDCEGYSSDDVVGCSSYQACPTDYSKKKCETCNADNGFNPTPNADGKCSCTDSTAIIDDDKCVLPTPPTTCNENYYTEIGPDKTCVTGEECSLEGQTVIAYNCTQCNSRYHASCDTEDGWDPVYGDYCYTATQTFQACEAHNCGDDYSLNPCVDGQYQVGNICKSGGEDMYKCEQCTAINPRCLECSDSSTCTLCQTGYTGNSCSECADGYHPDGDECVEDTEPDCDQTAKPQHCITEPLCTEGDWTCSGCATGWKSDGGICNTCADGYHPDGDECVEDTSTCDEADIPEAPGCATYSCIGGEWSCSRCKIGYTGNNCNICDETNGFSQSGSECICQGIINDSGICEAPTGESTLINPVDNTIETGYYDGRYFNGMKAEENQTALNYGSIMIQGVGAESHGMHTDEGTIVNSGEIGMHDNGAGSTGLFTLSGKAINQHLINISYNSNGAVVGMSGDDLLNQTDAEIYITNNRSGVSDDQNGAVGMYSEENAANKGLIYISRQYDGKIYGMLGSSYQGELTNGGQIELTNISQNTDSYIAANIYGMSGHKIINTAGAEIAINNNETNIYYTYIYGMHSPSTPSTNNGTIDISNNRETNTVYGMGENANLTNNSAIILQNNEAVYASGMATKSDYTQQNNGRIEMTNNTGITHGMFGNKLTNAQGSSIILSGNGSKVGDFLNGDGTGIDSTYLNGHSSFETGSSGTFETGVSGMFALSSSGNAKNSGNITINGSKVKATGIYGNGILKNGNEDGVNAQIVMSGNESDTFGMRGSNLTNYSGAVIELNDNGYDESGIDEGYVVDEQLDPAAIGMLGTAYSLSSISNKGTININRNVNAAGISGIKNTGINIYNGSPSGEVAAKISINDNYGYAYGMEGYDMENCKGATIELNNNGRNVDSSEGNISTIGMFSTLSYDSNEHFINNSGTIKITQNSGFAVGIGVDSTNTAAGISIVNASSGTIEMSGAADTQLIGIYARGNNISVVNAGSIEMSQANGLIGIYAAGEGVTVKNTGTIKINSSQCTGDACRPQEGSQYIVLADGASYIESGRVLSRSLNLSSADVGGMVVATATAHFEVAKEMKGDLLLSSDVVSEGFDNTYTVADMIDAGDVSDLHLHSQSALFEAELQNESDAVLTMKPFAEVVSNQSVASFLEQNYASGNNEELFNLLKTEDSSAALTSTINKLTADDVFNRFNFEDMTMMRELNADVNNKLFTDTNDHLTTSGSIAPFYFESGMGSNARYALYNTRMGRQSVGLSMAFSNVSSSDRHNNNTRKDETFQMSVPLGYNRHGFKLITTPRFGYAYGTYDRNGYNRTYDGTVEKRMLGLMNEVRYPLDMGGWSLAPAAEFNLLGYHIKGHEDGAPFALNIKSQNNYSVESGLGLYANKDLRFGKGQRLQMRAGIAAYHEFADPYTTELEMQGMSGSFKIRDERRKDDRLVVRAGFDYSLGDDFSLLGTIASYIDGTTHTNANLDFKYHF